MAEEASAGMNQRFTLDYSSFEKLLEAAWVLQCLQNHLHGPRLDRHEAIIEPVKIQKEIETVEPSVQVVAKPVLQFSSLVTDADRKQEVLGAQPADDKTLAELVETQPAIETPTLNFAAAAKVELKTVKLEKSLPSEEAMPHPIHPPLPVVTNPANNNDQVRARRRASFNLRTILNRTQDAFAHLLPNFRVNLTLPALRAVAIATPVWLLSLVAALLFLEVWRHESFQNAQAISRLSTPAMAAALSNTSTPLTATTRPVSEEVKRTNKEQRRFRPVPPREVSHRRITDPATSSVVQQLSRYEIRGLRRQATFGDASAAFALGMAYEVGRDVGQNCAEAARWVTMAAEAGDAAAQYNLGLRYRDADGVSADQAASEKWLRKAAAHRYPQAKLALKMLASR